MMANLFQPPSFIAVEGPLRVGKSTLAQILAESLHARRIVEPEDNPFLDRFYQAQSGMSFATQLWFLMERFEQLRQLKDFDVPVVSDYLFEKDKLFAYVNLSDAELDLYKRYYTMFASRCRRPTW
jgi:deoxyadenosine/deoxycytidine kinase